MLIQVPDPPTPPAQRLSDAVTLARDARDAVLIGVGLVYLLGYVTWSLTACAYHIGPLPAFQTQYLTAGIVPAVLLLAAVFASVWIRRMSVRLLQWAVPADGKPKALVLPAILLAAVVAALQVSLGSGTGQPASRSGIDELLTMARFSVRLFAIGYGAEALLVAAPALYRWLEDRNGRPRDAGLIPPWIKVFSTALQRTTFLLAVAGPVLLALALYVGRVYPRLPQELGGLRPRPARFDLLRSKVGTVVLGDLSVTPSKATLASPPAGIVRSAPLNVLFSTDAAYLVQPSRRGASSVVYEIPKEAVAVIIWENDTPGVGTSR